MSLTVAGILLAASLLAADPTLELRGKVTNTRSGLFRIGLYGVDHQYEQNTVILPGQEFRFRPLKPGSYLLEIRRRALGAIRRTIIISPSLADKKGVVRISIPYIPAEATLEGRTSLVSSKELAVPDKAWRRYQDARVRLSRHDVPRATESLLKAVEYAPQFSAAWDTLGVLSYQQHDYAKAEEYFRKAVDADPQSFNAQVNLGGVLLSLGQWQEALTCNLKAYSARPQDALANAQLGLTYFQMGDNERAEPYLAEAKRIDPSHFTRPQLYLARIYLNRGNATKAIVEIEDYVKRYPDSPEAEHLRQRISSVQSR